MPSSTALVELRDRERVDPQPSSSFRRASFLRLSFVFGSEDYNDVVNSGFPTDVFGIFVNGVNYALVPGTSSPISASTVNCGGPTSGPAPGGGQNCGLFRDNPPFFDTIDSEIDGFTTKFTLAIPVNTGSVNSIQLGIADNLDSFGDSALLLQAAAASPRFPSHRPMR